MSEVTCRTTVYFTYKFPIKSEGKISKLLTFLQVDVTLKGGGALDCLGMSLLDLDT